jgi:hypothetical protein
MPDLPGKSREQSVAELLARKEYTRAIEIVRGALQRRRNDPRLRMQLADILVRTGKVENGAVMLAEVADDLALGGEPALAIAALKRLQALQPGREDIEEKLAYMIAQQKRPTPDPWKRARRAIAQAAPPEPVRMVAPPALAFPGDLEEVSRPIVLEALRSEAAPDTRPPAPAPSSAGPGQAQPMEEPLLEFEGVARPAPEGEPLLDFQEPTPAPTASVATDTRSSAAAAVPPEAPATESQPLEVDDAFRDGLLAMIEDVFAPSEGGQVGATAGEMAAAPAVVVDTPLFQDFTAEELVEVIRGLRLRHFEAGEIVVTEGEPGASLFVLTTGTLRAYVRNAAGRNVKVRDLSEGDFFGEVSLLRGTGRTATLTAATWAELLEIDRDTLNAISQRHPRVWTVLKGFYDRRAGSTLEIAARGVQPDTGS